VEYRVIERKRLMNKAEADAVVGTDVTHREPDVTEPAIVVDADTGEPIVGYLPMERETTARLRAAVLDIPYSTTKRGSGVYNASRTFGMSPRKPLNMRDSCRPTTLSVERPEAHATICDAAYDLEAQLKMLFPDVWENDTATIEQVADDWRMAEDALWTSGVINKTSTLPYHRDGFNFETWSAMPVLRRGVKGGHLHFPEYDVTIGCRDGYSVYFCGFRYVHGVTPMETTGKDSYRYSVVYYALRGMKDCFSYAVEQRRAIDKRTEREDGVAAAVRGERAFNVGN